MALVPITHVYDTLSVINNTGLLDGQILYTTDQTVNKIFADVKVNNILRRIEIGGTNEIDTVLNQESGHAIANSAVAKLAQTVHTNLLNPTLGTTTVNGVTCTANGDGTYTLTGTASANASFVLRRNVKLDPDKTYKIIGCPSGGGASTYKIGVYGQTTETSFSGQVAMTPSYGSAHEIFNPHWEQYMEWGYGIQIVVYSGITLPSGGVTFKPMLTTDLSATYDDFVAYSGNGELNENVAEMYNNLATTNSRIDTTNSNVTALDTKVGSQSLLPTPSQSVTQNINTLKTEINQINADLSALIKVKEFLLVQSASATVWDDSHYYQDCDISSHIDSGYRVAAVSLSSMTNGGVLGVAMQSASVVRLINDANFSGSTIRIQIVLTKL